MKVNSTYKFITILLTAILLIGIFQSCGKRNLRNCCNSQNILIIPNQATYFIPNIFTPNADSINDVLFLYGTDFISVNWKIMDGNKTIFETDDVNVGWDGTDEGSLAKEKNYDVEASIQSIHGDYEISGKVCLVTECFHEDNFTKCMFGTQWDRFDYDNTLPSQETLGLCD